MNGRTNTVSEESSNLSIRCGQDIDSKTKTKSLILNNENVDLDHFKQIDDQNVLKKFFFDRY